MKYLILNHWWLDFAQSNTKFCFGYCKLTFLKHENQSEFSPGGHCTPEVALLHK